MSRIVQETSGLRICGGQLAVIVFELAIHEPVVHAGLTTPEIITPEPPPLS